MPRTAELVNRRKDRRLVFYRLAQRFHERLRQHCLIRLAEITSGEGGQARRFFCRSAGIHTSPAVP